MTKNRLNRTYVSSDVKASSDHRFWCKTTLSFIKNYPLSLIGILIMTVCHSMSFRSGDDCGSTGISAVFYAQESEHGTMTEVHHTPVSDIYWYIHSGIHDAGIIIPPEDAFLQLSSSSYI
ncbi:MAG: hypothetical protein IPM42_08230 [Saprospiraceae bacterium]|nr:hypothetical protein [Saprospiraceae bacterium]